MASKNTIPIRTSPEFKKMLDKIALERLKLGKDKKLLKTSRITKAITRLPDLEKVLIESEFR